MRTVHNEEIYEPPINMDPGDEVVISGIAGRFPDSDNMNELKENLFNKVDLVRADHKRWNLELPDLPSRMGTIRNLEKFDADFFDVPFEQANTLDPIIRILLELTYEAIVDAGINPKEMKGRNTAVIIGISFMESQDTFLYRNSGVAGIGVIGCSKSMTASFLSRWLDVKGPSYTIDTACSSSFYAMNLGYRYILSGYCEDAIIGTANLCIHPFINLQFSRLGVLAPDGYCRPFDIDAQGYTRSETVSVAYLQKAKNAKRIYATISYVKTNSDGYKEEGITYPSTHAQSVLLTEFYKECGLSPTCLDYIEAHGTATKVGDPQEINAIYNVLCKDRKTPLLIGSIKSNLGHSEPSSGFTQIAKTIIALETGYVPPNINFVAPRNDIEVLVNGSIKVVLEPAPLKNGYIAINSFGFGGANAHILMRWNTKTKLKNGAPNDDLPRLVTLSGRTEESVKSFLNDVASYPIDVEYIRLLHDIHADSIDGHPWRGYIILNTLKQNPIKEVQYHEGARRPLCFIFSALGSQTPEMGRNLLRFHAFASAIRICNDVLKPYDINVTDILTKADAKVCQSALHSFVSIVAVQIGLVDLLASLGIIPDYMIGHSASELSCAYADECLNIEQTILSAYFIGLACAERKVIRGSMATVGLDYERLKDICPTNIEIACRNGPSSCVISGPAEFVQQFIKKLQADNIHVEEIFCNNVPYHSSYLSSVESQLLSNLKQVIPQPRKRSSRWLSTSVPFAEGSTDSTAKLSSASYHTSSIMNTVLFEQTAHLIPDNAVTIELAPDCVLQRVLKESLHPKMTNIALTRRAEQDATDVILRGIGELYNCGLQPQLANLYPPVEFPVSRGTPMIAPSVRWDHSDDWFVTIYKSQQRLETGERSVEVNLMYEEYEYMSGHVIDGRTLLPATGYLALVWETISMMTAKIITAMPIVFKDIKFLRATYLPKDTVVKLMITIQKDSGKFEVTDGDSVVVTGTAYTVSDTTEEIIPADQLPEDDDEEESMTIRDIYKELRLRGYQYSGGFRGLRSASVSGRKGHLVWIGNWVTFMDTMLQLQILGKDTRSLFVPTSIDKLVIDPVMHMRELRTKAIKDMLIETDQQIPIKVYKELDAIIAGGIQIRGAKATSITRRKPTGEPVIEEYRFVAHHDRAEVSVDEAIRLSVQIAVEDHQIVKVKAVELVEDADNVMLQDLSSVSLLDALGDMPLIQTNVTLLTSPNRFDSADLPSNISIVNLNKSFTEDNVLMVIGFDLLTKQQSSLERLLPFLKEGGYLLTRERYDTIDYDKYLCQYKLNVILEKRTERETILLFKKKVLIKKTIVVHINNNDFTWLKDLKSLVDENEIDMNGRTVIVGEGDFECGLLGFINCLRKEPGGEFIRGIFIQDEGAPKFSLQDAFYVEQLQKDLTMNVLRPNKTWGSYRHLRLSHPEPVPVSAAYIHQMVRGDLSTFCWMENDILLNTHKEKLIRVIYSSINFKDVMLATGKLIMDILVEMPAPSLGLEFVGFDCKGQRVMGICKKRGIANIIVKDDYLTWNIPDAWTFEEAATVACTYSTSYYALYILGNMKKGEKILIHSGTGGVGQAAIHLALNEGCEVFTTVGTEEKRRFIRKMFPSISDDHIGTSRDTSFEQMVGRQTKGRGVNIVLNSLAEEKLIASVRCLGREGRFLEIGKFDLIANNTLNMDAFQKNISFYGVMLDNLIIVRHKHKFTLWKLMTEGLKNGVIKPLQVNVFPKTEIEAAFRYMTAGKHIGKIILKIQEEDKPLSTSILAQRCYYCLSNRTYIILGGLGGFGLELTHWLIDRGAKHVVLTSRNGIKNGYQRSRIHLWKSYGVNVLVVKSIDASNPDDCEQLLRIAEKEAPVDAIFNLAVVLRDNILKNQTAESFAESFISKAWTTQILDKLSRRICRKLRHFVVFSSVSCGKGNSGQTNYGMSNSVMERVCERRAKEGLPGLAIQWGAVGDVGLVADMQEDDKELVIGGTLQQKISSCLEELDKFLLQSRPVVSSIVVAEKKAGSAGFMSVEETVASIMDIRNVKEISHNISLAELGMDSMMAVEIKQTLEREFDVLLTTQEIRNLTFANLQEISKTDDDNSQIKTPITNNHDVTVNYDANGSNTFKLLVGIAKDEDFVSDICNELSTKREKDTIQVFLVPGLEGCGTIFNRFASKIKFPAVYLQYDANNVGATSSMSEIADCLLKSVLPKLKSGNEFVMVGYSFGSILAIELTKRLEALNFKGRLLLIDGAPKQIKLMYDDSFPNFTDAEIETYILGFILELYRSETSEEELAELRKCERWEKRLDICMKQVLAASTVLSPKNLRLLATTVYKHIRAIPKYNISALPRIKSSITLLKPTLPMIFTSKIEEDYGLYEITQDKVEVHYIEGTHVTIMNNNKVIAAINGEAL